MGVRHRRWDAAVSTMARVDYGLRGTNGNADCATLVHVVEHRPRFDRIWASVTGDDGGL